MFLWVLRGLFVITVLSGICQYFRCADRPSRDELFAYYSSPIAIQIVGGLLGLAICSATARIVEAIRPTPPWTKINETGCLADRFRAFMACVFKPLKNFDGDPAAP